LSNIGMVKPLSPFIFSLSPISSSKRLPYFALSSPFCSNSTI
jgi:hypothetical protein